MGLTIYINWEYFLGIIGALIAIAYYTNGRFTRIETSLEWINEALWELKINSDNRLAQLFSSGSPVSLTRAGKRVLHVTGMKAYIDANKERLSKHVHHSPICGPYELQTRAFRFFAHLKFDQAFDRNLKECAFSAGTSTDLLRRIGAIYFRDIAVRAKAAPPVTAP